AVVVGRMARLLVGQRRRRNDRRSGRLAAAGRTVDLCSPRRLGERPGLPIAAVIDPAPFALRPLPDGGEIAMVGPVRAPPRAGIHGRSPIARNPTVGGGPIDRFRRVLAALEELLNP